MSKNVKIEAKKKDGGFYFPVVDIHVIAKNETEALKIIKQTHGVDVQKETNAHAAAAERLESEKNNSSKNAKGVG